MRELRELYLYPITGLYDECHNIHYTALRTATPPTDAAPTTLRILNSLWWHEALGRQTLETIVTRLRARYVTTPVDNLQHRAILADPEQFIQAVQEAPKTISNLAVGPRAMFGALETLQIFCNVYSDTISAPYALSLQEGLVLNELSSLVLAREALNPASNPYLPFIERSYLPVLELAQPDLLWIVGPIKMSTFAMAMLARARYPTCHITVTAHSTEYYSLNKITKYLKNNAVLFSTIDSIILDDFDNTGPQLREALASGQPLETVPNLLFAERRADGGAPQIKDTPLLTAQRTADSGTHRHPVSVRIADRTDANHLDPSAVVDVKLWPNAKCFWDQCNFCAINRKYQTLIPNSFRDAAAVAHHMLALAAQGVTHFWSIDEAIPPHTLGELASLLVAAGANFTWETRSKIDRGFTPEVCELLGRAGLREIRLGLESASPRVLSAMGKFPTGWSLDFIEQVVRNFHEAGVSVHFPTIIGFPTETERERQETYAFLEYLVRKYPSVTFNMNILGFDVASKLFEHYEEFGITSIRWPAPAKYFLGNLLDWDCDETPFNYDRLDRERNELMRRLLYPWIPSTATIPTYIFYRLSETSRATMAWKERRYATGNWTESPTVLTADAIVRRSPTLVNAGRIDRGQYASVPHYVLYDWRSHHSFECDEQELALLDVLREPRRIGDVGDDALVNVMTQLHWIGAVDRVDGSPVADDALALIA